MTGDMRFIIIVLLFVCFTWSALAQPRLQAQLGVLDARHWNFQKDRLALSGYWKAIEGKLVSPQDINTASSEDYFFPAPMFRPIELSAEVQELYAAFPDLSAPLGERSGS